MEVEGRTQQVAGMEVGGQCSQDAFEGLKGRSELGRNLIREDKPHAWHSLPSTVRPAAHVQLHGFG